MEGEVGEHIELNPQHAEAAGNQSCKAEKHSEQAGDASLPLAATQTDRRYRYRLDRRWFSKSGGSRLYGLDDFLFSAWPWSFYARIFIAT
jgi:hypothetical protein